MIQDRLLHRLVKLGPEGALTGALAALDIALWDLKGQLLSQPIWRLIGGAWRTALPFYASIGGNGAGRRLDEVLRLVEARMAEKPAAIKIRFDNDRVDLDNEIPDHIAKARAVRKLVGDAFPLAFDANNGYTPGGAMRVGRVLEELGYWWFEEPVQHYHVRATGEVARKLSITVSAGEQSYTPAAVADLILAGVPMVQPDIVKMGGITGMLRCAALAQAHGAEFVPHQAQPTIGHMANLHVAATQLHATKPCELNLAVIATIRYEMLVQDGRDAYDRIELEEGVAIPVDDVLRALFGAGIELPEDGFKEPIDWLAGALLGVEEDA